MLAFFLWSPAVLSQLDATQLDTLLNSQIDDDSSDEEIQRNDSLRLPNETNANQGLTQQEPDDLETNFGYQGRNDFMVEPGEKFKDEPLKPFGYDYFDNNRDFLNAPRDIPVPPEYIIGPGDTIKIILYGSQNKKYTLQVNREGEIFLPEIGPISIAGLSFRDLKDTVYQIINAQLIGTQVSLTMGNLRSINIFVLGDAKNPGMYSVPALSTLTNAIFANGGIRNTGSLRNIQLKRNGKIVTSFDFYDLLLNGDTSKDSRLISGDVVFIPPIGKRVGIAGEVTRPGIYEIINEENLEDLIDFAGRLTARADLSSMQLERIDKISNSFVINKFKYQNKLPEEKKLEDGDKLIVSSVADKINNAVLLKGHALKSGFYPWFEGMKITDILPNKQSLLPMTDMGYVLIKREQKFGQSYRYLQVNLESLFENIKSDDNVELMNRDEIIIFPSLLDINQIKTVETDDSYKNSDQKLNLHYLRKSILERKSILDPNKDTLEDIEESDDQYSQEMQNQKKSFYYMVNNYCVVDEAFLNVLLEDLDSEDQKQTVNTDLTAYCRNQMIDPLTALSTNKDSIKEDNVDQLFTLFGNVKFPGKYPITENASLRSAISAGGGLSGLSFLSEIDVARKRIRGKNIDEVTFNISPDQIDNFKLMPLDSITIKKIDLKDSLVVLEGEVNFPGIYPIRKGETLTELINRAGGFKDGAGIMNSFFQRKSLIESELKAFNQAQSNLKKQILMLSNQSLGNVDGNEEYLEKITMLVDEELPDEDNIGRLILDFESIFNGEDEDIVLLDGDSIFVPKIPQTVRVLGEAMNPSAHSYKMGKNISYYIQASGGLNNFADSEGIYIIKQNGSVSTSQDKGGFFRGSENTISPGDTIVIPLEIDTYSNLKATTEITQIIYQLALSAAAVNSF